MNVVELSYRIDVGANIVARVYYSTSIELDRFMEEVRSMEYVHHVSFSELVEVMSRPDTNLAAIKQP